MARIAKDYVFRDGGGDGDQKNSACGLSIAYTRYLLALTSLPFVGWYVDGDRVNLTDQERQVIEDGDRDLANMLISGGCPPMQNFCVYSQNPVQPLLTSDVEHFVNFEREYGENWYGQGNFTPILPTGAYLFNFNLVLTYAAGYTTVTTFMRSAADGSLLARIRSERQEGNAVVMSAAFVRVVSPGGVEISMQQQASEGTSREFVPWWAQRLTVVRLGDA